MKSNTITKKILLMLFAVFFMAGSLMATDPENNKSDEEGEEQEEILHDTIYKLGGKMIIGNVVNVRTSTIYYTLPGEENQQQIERKQVQKIVYKNGAKEEFNEPLLTMVEDGDWKAIFCTKKKKDIESLYRRGVAEVEAIARKRSIKAAKNNAEIKIKKKAANMGGNVVYILKAEAKGGYGEYPSYYIKGEIYSFEPPKPGEAGHPGNE